LKDQIKELEFMLADLTEKRELEHKRYVYCKEMIQHQDMEIQKLNIKYQIDTGEMKRLHDAEIDKLT
jgi:hypothetical protein